MARAVVAAVVPAHLPKTGGVDPSLFIALASMFVSGGRLVSQMVAK
jgi:hypothetical protein